MDFLAEIIQAREFTLGSCLLRIVLAFVAGFVIGFERERHHQPAGLRTHILICVSSALIMIVSLAVGSVSRSNPPWQADASRIAAQVVSGIGFLGAGVILHQGINIRGLTSAATIWSISALGLAIGAGLYIPAFTALAVLLIVLNAMELFERRVMPSKEAKELFLFFRADTVNMKELIGKLKGLGIKVDRYEIGTSKRSGAVSVHLVINYAGIIELDDIRSAINTTGDLEKIRLNAPR